MGERAKIIINEYTALEILQRPDFDINKFYSSDLKTFINVSKKEIERLNKRVKECEEAYLRTRHQYSELENKYLTDEYIINELEKWLNEFETKEFNYNFLVVRIKDIQDKLQELKGDSSNEIH